MNYKETLYFVAKCLTISFEEKNKDSIQKQLKSNNIDWDNVVRISTAHYIFPALYCNFKRANFLHYLPKELVVYMQYITGLNRERNLKIIDQARGLNKLLLDNKITPIFLKGTGNILAGIYEDIAERMIGDIDFIFSYEDYPKAINILRESGYSEVNKSEYYSPEFRHYSRLQKKNKIAAIDIHKEILIEKYKDEFNYNIVNIDNQIINGFSVLSYANKLNLSIISNQINDDGFYYKTIELKNAYDVFLLSKKVNAQESVNTLDKLRYPLNCFLAACFEIFNHVDSLGYNTTTKVESYLSVFKSQLINPSSRRRKSKLNKFFILIKKVFYILCRSLTRKEYRIFLFKSLTDINWYKQKLVQFGIKK